MSWKSSRNFVTGERTWWPAYTPFLRRYFGNEEKRERRETEALYERIQARWPREGIAKRIAREVDEAVEGYIESQNKVVSIEYRATLSCFLEDLVSRDPVLTPLSEFTDVLSLKEVTDLRSNLFARERYLEHRATYEERLSSTLFDMVTGTLEAAEHPESGDGLLSVPLGSLVYDIHDVLTRIINSFSDDVETGFHKAISRQLYRNLCRMNKVDPEAEHKRQLLFPNDTSLPLEEVLGYVADTPFHTLFSTTLPLHIPIETFFSHMHVVGGSGAGKTQWLSSLILHHLRNPDQPSLVVVDSQGDLIRTLSRLEEFAYDERLIVISPKDIHYPPAINIFDVKLGRTQTYDDVTREQVVAGAIQTLDYLFSGILGADLTAKQGVFFRFLARLLLKLPEVKGRNATLLDMLELTETIEPYRDVVAALDPVQRKFFERDFDNKDFRPTKEQLRYRLNGILENPTLERLFTASATKLDLFQELNQGAVILIDTAKDFLKDNSGNYGRIFIALVLQAIMERAAIPERERRPTHLIIDEAHEYFDQNIDDLLTQVRKYKLGCVFAHQYMGQCSVQLKASLAANTAIKMASGVSVNDARLLAPDMRTTSEFILNQPKLQFAAYVKGTTSHALPLSVTPGRLEQEFQMSDDDYDLFVKWNRERVADTGSPNEKQPAEETEPPPDHPEPPSGDDPTKPGEW